MKCHKKASTGNFFSQKQLLYINMQPFFFINLKIYHLYFCL